VPTLTLSQAEQESGAGPFQGPPPASGTALMDQLKYFFFAHCVECGQAIVLYEAPDAHAEPLPPADSKMGGCLYCGKVHVYRPSEMLLAVE
jgi:hypothetical protein